MKTRMWLLLVAGALLGAALPVFAQDEDEVDLAVLDAAEPAAPEVVQAWGASAEAVDEAAGAGAAESDAFARIHEADAALLELQQAERTVGFDLLDGVR